MIVHRDQKTCVPTLDGSSTKNNIAEEDRQDEPG